MENYHYIVGTEGGVVTGNMFLTPTRWLLPEGLVQAACEGTHLSFAGLNTDLIQGSSIAFDKELAVKGALGEFFERYCAAYEDVGMLRICSYQDLLDQQEEALHPSEMKPYSDRQYEAPSFRYRRYMSSEKIAWTQGVNLVTNTPIWVPAFLVHLPHNPKYDGGKEYIVTTSTGVSAGRNIKEAIRGGFLECVERHAFSEFWYRQKTVLDSTPFYSEQAILQSFPANLRIQKLFKNPSIRIKTFRLPIYKDCVETFFSVLTYSYRGKNLISVGAASRFNTEEAITKAAMEAYQGIEYGILLLNKEQGWKENDADFGNVDNFSKHFIFYNKFQHYRSDVPLLKKVFRDPGSDDPIIDLRIEEKSLLSLELEKLIAIKLTTPDSADSGYEVVRVIVPGLIYLTGTHHAPFLGGFDSDPDDLFLELPHLFP